MQRFTHCRGLHIAEAYQSLLLGLSILIARLINFYSKAYQILLQGLLNVIAKVARYIKAYQFLLFEVSKLSLQNQASFLGKLFVQAS